MGYLLIKKQKLKTYAYLNILLYSALSELVLIHICIIQQLNIKFIIWTGMVTPPNYSH